MALLFLNDLGVCASVKDHIPSTMRGGCFKNESIEMRTVIEEDLFYLLVILLVIII